MVRISICLCLFLLMSSAVSGQRPVPHVITGRHPGQQDVPWPSARSYQTPGKTGGTFYERAYARVQYYRHAPSCAAHRRQYYPSYGKTVYVRR